MPEEPRKPTVLVRTPCKLSSLRTTGALILHLPSSYQEGEKPSWGSCMELQLTICFTHPYLEGLDGCSFHNCVEEKSPRQLFLLGGALVSNPHAVVAMSGFPV
jgi:hypothetical protein